MEGWTEEEIRKRDTIPATSAKNEFEKLAPIDLLQKFVFLHIVTNRRTEI
jgi:hypothetical protein